VWPYTDTPQDSSRRRGPSPYAGGGNGAALNLFDVYEVEQSRGIVQIDADLGTPRR
jgi:hypothetical protein